MKAIFVVLSVLFGATGFAAFLNGPAVTQQIAGGILLVVAALFMIAGLHPAGRARKKIGSGEIAGLPFDYFDDGTVIALNDRGKKTIFPSFSLFERCLQSQHPSAQQAAVFYEGWGKKMQ